MAEKKLGDKFIARCAGCGSQLGPSEVVFLPGTKTMGCHACREINSVVMKDDGSVRIVLR